jgi:hypothetical protein
MKAKLFLAYLRIRKLLPAIALFCLGVSIYDRFLKYRYSLAIADTSPWIVEEVIYGDRFVASRNGKQFEIYLCGIAAKSNPENFNDNYGSRDYLRSL